MGLNRTLGGGYGELPSQLWGLLNWSFLNPSTFNQTGEAFYDVAYVPDIDYPLISGKYILVGNGVRGGTQPANDRTMIHLDSAGLGSKLILSSTESWGGTTPPQVYTGIVAWPWGMDWPTSPAISAPRVAVVGAGSPYVHYADDTNIALPANWNDLGDAASAYALQGDEAVHVDVFGPEDIVMVCRKSVTVPGKGWNVMKFNESGGTWVHKVVPDSGNGALGYRKVKGSLTSRIIACTSDGKIDLTGDTSGGTLFQDSATGVTDIAYSRNTDEYAYVNSSNNINTTVAAGIGAASVSWTAHTVPYASIGYPFNTVEALDFGWSSLFTATANKDHFDWRSPETWWIASGLGRYASITKDWSTWYKVPMPGHVNASPSDLQPERTRMKYVHDRLFIFTVGGVYVSGPLGFGARSVD